MDVATILFTYNRSWHTRQVLDALSRNTVLPNKLYIFQDGTKENTNREEWSAVSGVINSVSWCSTEVIISEKNKGLANSIKSGVNKVFEKYDAVIVLEDDCVPHPQFMEYILKALEKYELCKEVYHIGASSEPVEVEENGTDAYFMGRINSCGWGTWKDRWEQLCNDYTMIAQIKRDKQLYEWFKLWGEDTEASMLGNVKGITDSWAAFWALTVIMKKGYCLAPYESFIKNIGFDDTGVHSGNLQPIMKIRSNEKLSAIVLPDRIEFVNNYRQAFACYYPWTDPAIKNEYYKNVVLDLLEIVKKKISIANYLKGKGIENVVIWGKGRIADFIMEELKMGVEVRAITETHPTDHVYKGIPLVNWRDIPRDISAVIVIPGFDIERIRDVVQGTNLGEKIMPIGKLVSEILGSVSERVQKEQ